MNEYLNIFLGALVGWVLPYIFKFAIFIIKMHKKSPIYGKWFLYLWWTDNNNVEFVEMNTLIKRGILCKHKIRCWDDVSCYNGEVKIEDNNLCVEMNANDAIQISSTYHRYDLSTLEKRDKLFGFWLSFDGDNNVSCGGAILTRNKINNVEKENIMRENFKINRNYPLLVLKK